MIVCPTGRRSRQLCVACSILRSQIGQRPSDVRLEMRARRANPGIDSSLGAEFVTHQPVSTSSRSHSLRMRFLELMKR